MSDYDPRIVALYDEDNPDGPDHDWYRLLADEIDARTILDVGCGTGMLTVTFARPGRQVHGIDPSPAMLDHATRRPGADQVTWTLGDSSVMTVGNADLAVMTGNVAQHIPDPAWERTLADLSAALRPGGLLAFESRNPPARAWEYWTSAEPTRRGSLRQWTEARELPGGRVQLDEHTIFDTTGEHIVEAAVLSFRSRALLESQLAAAGFEIVGVWGDWNRTPQASTSPLLVFEARRR